MIFSKCFFIFSAPLVPATEEMVAIFRELLEEHNYMNDRACEGYDDETLTVS